MGIKEEYLEWCVNTAYDEHELQTWHEYKKVVGVDFSDEYFHNVIIGEETAEEEIKETPLMFQTDPGLIGGNIDLVDMST